MTRHSICILGGTGFVGRYLIHQLQQQGHDVKVITRRNQRHRGIMLTPQSNLIEGNAQDPAVLNAHFQGCDTVINLVGILNEGGSSFQSAHVDLTRKIVDAAGACGVTRLLQMSALNADAGNGASQYLRSKGEAEDLAHASGLKVTSLRPSVIFGPGDSFFNRFAGLLKWIPYVFPLACPDSRLAPVFVGDVCAAMIHALDDPKTVGQRLELCGPHTYSLLELVQYAARVAELDRDIIGLSPLLSRLQARIMGWVPGKPFSMDNYLSLQTDSVCSRPAWDALGITPTPLEGVVPQYLGKSRTRTRYHDWRRDARRNEG